MLLAAVAVAAIVAPLTERGLLRFFYGRDEVLLVLVTYALFLILEDVTKLIWGANPYFVSEPYACSATSTSGIQSYVGYDFALVGLARRRRAGGVVGAEPHPPGQDRAGGDPQRRGGVEHGRQRSRVYMLAFSVGIFLAALGGAFTAPMISVQPGVSVGVVIVSFAVVIIGGLGSIEGAAIGALIVGLARSLAVHLAPVAELFAIYVVMAMVLMFRPEGLFQRIQARKI